MTGPIIPDELWPEGADRHCWDANGLGFFHVPTTEGAQMWLLVLKQSHIPLPAGWDWRVPVMRPTCKDSLPVAPAIDLEQFRPALEHALLSIQSEEKRADIDRLLALIDGQKTAPRGPDQPDLCDLCRVREEVRSDAEGIPFCQECWDGWQTSEQPSVAPVGVERLRAEQAAAVMPLIGPLLDAWERVHPDDSVHDSGIARYIEPINRAMKDGIEPSAPYSIDADPDGIRARVADAITGALAFGAQGNHKPPSGHWLEPFWDMARADSEAPSARQLAEWHEDDGPAMWWAWCGSDWAGEPAWCGTPNDSDWPGYHTHWTPHPAWPMQPTKGEGE